jgi:hypothetical protein
MAILRFFAGLMVWLTIALVNAALAGCTLYAYNLSGLLSRAGQWGSVISDKLPKGQDPTGQLSQSTSHIKYLCAGYAMNSGDKPQHAGSIEVQWS